MNKKFLYKFNFAIIILIIVLIKEINFTQSCNGDQQFDWFQDAQNYLEDRVNNLEENTNYAKNVIFFLGSGMSVQTLTAARIHLEQRSKQTNESCEFELDKFKHTAYSKTYCADSMVADSGCAATAYMTGVKGNIGTIGLTQDVKALDFKAAKNGKYRTTSIVDWAQKAGKFTGIVTKTRVTHVSAAGAYAHSSFYALESDYEKYQAVMFAIMTADNSKICPDIALQLMQTDTGRLFNVIFGGGRNKFLPNSEYDFSSASKYGSGERLDGRDYIDFWLKDHKRNNGKYVTTRDELLKVNFDETNYILGLFADDHMKFNLDNVNKEEPSLAEMTEAAIKIMKKNSKGFFLFVDAGHINNAHDRNMARLALDETIELTKAIRVAKSLVSEENTLIVVTADHAHLMSISGYSNRNTDILGLSDQISDIDNLTYTTLSYANGEDQKRLANGKRKNLLYDDFTDNYYQYPANVPFKGDSYGGDDVPIFASGPWAHLFRGTMEQNQIPHLIGFAACIGNGNIQC